MILRNLCGEIKKLTLFYRTTIYLTFRVKGFMQSSLSSFEKIGGVVAFLPGFSSIFGIVKSCAYWDKAKKVIVTYQANKIDAFASQMLKIAEERRACYDTLWKISIVQIIPGLNIIAAIFEVKVLLKLSTLHDEIPQNAILLPITEFDRQVELFAEEITRERLSEIKLKDFREIFKIFNDQEKTRDDRLALILDVIHCIRGLKNDTPATEKLYLFQIVGYLSNRIDNIDQKEQLKELEFFLFDELLKEFKAYFKKITTTSTFEYEKHKKMRTQLLNPIELSEMDLNCPIFCEEFNKKAALRLQLLDFQYIDTEEELIFTKLIIIYQKSIRYAFATLDEFRPFIKVLEKQLDFYMDLKSSLQNAFKIQSSMLHQKKLTFLQAPIPLNYNYTEHTIFLTFQEELKNNYKKIPKNYPVTLRHASTGQEVVVETQNCYLKLKSIYKTQKTLIHDQMIKCLPKEYPVYMPNLLTSTGEPSIRLNNAPEMTWLVSIYASYFERKEDIMKGLDKLINNKVLTLSLLKTPL